MELDQVYAKTAKGQEEIQRRTHKLPAHTRRVLILVDGQSTVAEMIQRLTALGNIEPLLAQLEADGFIIPQQPAEHTPPEAETPPAPLKPPRKLIAALLPKRLLIQEDVPDRNDPPPVPYPSPVLMDETTTQAAQSELNLTKAKSFIRFALLDIMGSAATNPIKRIGAAATPEELLHEVIAIRDMLPTLLPRQQAEKAWQQLKSIMLWLNPSPP